MQETQVQFLIQEDPTCSGVTKPVHHSYWTCPLEFMNQNYWNPHTLEPVPPQENLPQREVRAPQLQSSSCLPQKRKAHAATKTQHGPKIINYIKKTEIIYHGMDSVTGLIQRKQTTVEQFPASQSFCLQSNMIKRTVRAQKTVCIYFSIHVCYTWKMSISAGLGFLTIIYRHHFNFSLKHS